METKHMVIGVLGAFLCLAYFGQDIKTYLKTPKSGGSSSSATFVSEGPRWCDGKTITVKIQAGEYRPGRVGCKANWNINEQSPWGCVIPLGPTQQPIFSRPICTGQEILTANQPMTGWRATEEETWIDVTYNL